MAQSDELNANQKMSAFLESLVQRQDQPKTINCYLCEQVFLDTKTLVNHLKSHSYLNGYVYPNSLFQSFATPENEILHSFSASLNTRRNIANENLGSNAQQTVASNPSKLPLDDSLVLPPSKKPAELIFKYQPYPSSLISRSAINHGISGLHSNGKQVFSSPISPKTSANINSKSMEGSKFPLGDSLILPPSKKPAEFIFRYQPYPSPLISRSGMNHGVSGSRSLSNWKQNFSSPIGPKTSAIINSKIMEGSKLQLGDSLVSPPSKNPAEMSFRHQPYPYPSISHSAMNHGVWGLHSNEQHNFSSPFWPKTSAIINSKIIEGSNFHFPMKHSSFSPLATVGKPSQSVEGTSGLGCRKHLQTTMKSDRLGPMALSTKPFINQLEQPIEEMTADCDTDGDELDLTLKL